MICIENSLRRDVGVNLSSCQIAVAQQFLHASEVGTTVEQMGGEAMPESVRTGGSHDTGMN